MTLESILRHQMVAPESTFATLVAWASNHHLGVVSLEISPDVNIIDLKEAQGTQSYIGSVQGRYSGKWKLEAEVRRPSAAGGLCPLHNVIRAGYGNHTVNAGVDVDYTLLGGADTISTLQLCNYTSNLQWLMQANGCVITKFGWEVNSDAVVKYMAEGEFADFSLINGLPLLTADLTSGTAAVTLDEIYKIFVGNAGVRVAFDDGEDNGGAGYIAQSRTIASDLVTLSTNALNTVSTGAGLIPHVPASSYASTEALSGMNSQVTIDGTTVPVISAKIEVETGLSLINNEATYDRPTRAYRKGRRKVGGSIVMYMEPENAYIFGGGLTNVPRDVTIRMGSGVATYNITHNMPNCFLKFPSGFELGNEDAADFTVDIMGALNSASDDELVTTI